ncbi:MAG: hypothetical protein KIS70_10620 [Xanthobacteraceae bacterium]|nr:hypothetical protein [Xanthobacteraceae bacterium]
MSTTMTPEQLRARKRRNLILGFSIGAFVLLVFMITLVRLGADVMVRPL